MKDLKSKLKKEELKELTGKPSVNEHPSGPIKGNIAPPSTQTHATGKKNNV